MWNKIKNVFERHTLFNKVSALKRFYTANMSTDKYVLQFCLLSSTLKSMKVTSSESEMAMALLNGLPRSTMLLTQETFDYTRDMHGIVVILKLKRMAGTIHQICSFCKETMTSIGNYYLSK